MVKGIDRPMQATSWQSPKRLKKKRETSSSIAYSLYIRCCCTEFLAQAVYTRRRVTVMVMTVTVMAAWVVTMVVMITAAAVATMRW